LTRPLSARFGKVVGINISSKMIELVRIVSPFLNCTVIFNDTSDLSQFSYGHFDFVLSLLTFLDMNPSIAKTSLR